MRRLIIGDTHGNGIIRDIYEYENPDEVIILGDYFDSFTLSPIVQKLHFKDILELREEHLKTKKGKFILLLGNHEYHYLRNTMEMYAGYNDETAGLITLLLEDLIEKNIIQICYIDTINRIIFSHAGVTNTWFNKYCKSLNDINNVNYEALRFVNKGSNNLQFDGDTPYNSPIWVRPNSLYADCYTDKDGIIWNQIFGHTHNERIKPYYIDNEDDYDKNAYLFNIDCFPNGYLIQEINDTDGKLKFNDFCDVNY